MAFRKAITAEALKLFERLCRKFLRVAILHHAGDQLLGKFRDAARVLEGRHGATELVGLAGREPRTFDRNPHRLFLKQWHAERLAEDPLQFGLGINGLLLPLTAPQIGMDHVALDWAGPDNGDLDDEVIEAARKCRCCHASSRAPSMPSSSRSPLS